MGVGVRTIGTTTEAAVEDDEAVLTAVVVVAAEASVDRTLIVEIKESIFAEEFDAELKKNPTRNLTRKKEEVLRV